MIQKTATPNPDIRLQAESVLLDAVRQARFLLAPNFTVPLPC